MGQKLSAYFDEAANMGGFKARMRLAILTKVGGDDAASAPDSPENIKKFEDAMTELRKEFQ